MQPRASLPSSFFDPNSFANLNQFLSQHVVFNWDVDFTKQVISGSVVINGKILSSPPPKEIILDSKDLFISKVSLNGTTDLQFKHAPNVKTFGQPLHIQIPNNIDLTPNTPLSLHIYYHTSPNASAIQWLSPSQTAGKIHPYLFTQSQAIHARSLFPCQDSCTAKVTYEASVTVPKQLTALMSAERRGVFQSDDTNTATYSFNQKIPIPSYLIALAVGKLVSKKIGPRSSVWCEEQQIEAAAWEFAETETYLSAAEKLLGPYVWGTYDILLLPPSFPYGGMENPMLTFVTPTLIAGDRSNCFVIAHEIVHSWCGNLVTNKTWEHFWLNEGFTRFNEGKIVGLVHGEPMRHLQTKLGMHNLEDAINHFGHQNQLTALIPNLEGIDPDDAFSSVPYEKGAALLWYLESLVGRPPFEEFMRKWIDKYKHTVVVSEDFKDFFNDYFKDNSAIAGIHWEDLLRKPGLPDYQIPLDTSLTNSAHQLVKDWVGRESADTLPTTSIDGWSAVQIQVFLDGLRNHPNKLHPSTLSQIDSLYQFSTSGNCEIKFRWLSLAISCEHTAAVEPALKFVTSQGRMKYVRPLYRSLYNSQIGKQAAIDTFKSHKPTYHAIAARMISIDLGLND